jgi:hypothetical protein
MATSRLSSLYDSLCKDKHGHVVLGQRPNAPIIGWAIFKLVELLMDDPSVKAGSASLATAFLFVWAYLEITAGVNGLRRILGAVVMAVIIVGFFR